MAFAVVTAGGRGSRLGGALPKMETEVLGKPLLLYALDAFERAGSIDEIVVTVPPERLAAWPITRLRQHGIAKIMACVAGGATRQDSVRLALEEIPHGGGVVVVHDGARPLVTPGLIEAVSEIPKGADGVITVIPVADTLKEVDGVVVKSTLDRENIVAVQTPQSFPLEVLRKAHRRAVKDGFHGTDDAVLVERLGGVVRVVEGDRENFKVTFPEDLKRVESVLRARSGG